MLSSTRVTAFELLSSAQLRYLQETGRRSSRKRTVAGRGRATEAPPLAEELVMADGCCSRMFP